MKPIKLKTILVFLITFVLSTVQNQLHARDYFTVYMDSINNGDTVQVCNSIDTIRIIPPGGLTDRFFAYYNKVTWELDTFYVDTLYIKGNYGSMLMCEGFDGLNWQTKWIGIAPFSTWIHHDNYGTHCNEKVHLNVSLYDYKGKAKYHWLPETGVDNPSSLNPVITLSANTTFTISITTNEGCTEKDSISLTLTPMDPPPVCIVGVNESNKNRIVWERPASESIISYNIYKETNVTDVYEKIGTVDYDSSGIFTDTFSYPDIQSSKYRISFNDVCGLESVKSIPHKTMHLSVNQGLNNIINLIWEPYEGFTASSYNIYRGANPVSLSLIGSTSGGSTQYSDLTPPSGNPYYQVEVIGPKNCNPWAKTKAAGISSSRSNIADLYSTAIKDLKSDEFPLIYPNPAGNLLSIELDQNSRNSVIEISNLEGRQVLKKNILTSHTNLNIGYFPDGMYIIRITTGSSVKTGKFVKCK